jgi:general stress protein 26
MTTARHEILALMRTHSLGVQASVSSAEVPQAALVGFVVTDGFELFFDTLGSSRKMANLRRNPRIAFVIGGPGGGEAWTVQYEGVADEPGDNRLQQLKELYFARFPDGRDRGQWPGIAYVRVRPRWLRFSDYRRLPAEIVELECP